MKGLEKILGDGFFELSFSGRVAFLFNLFEGIPYLNNPIEDNFSGLLRFDGFDCVTFIETILAISLSDSYQDIEKNIVNLRYYQNEISWSLRHHFTSIDWIPSNMGILKSLNADCCVHKIISRLEFFKKNKKTLPGFLAKKVFCRFPYTSIETLKKINLQKELYLALVIGKKEWIIVDHVGFLQKENGVLYFVHASSKHGNVVKEDFYDYINRIQESKLGISLFDIRRY